METVLELTFKDVVGKFRVIKIKNPKELTSTQILDFMEDIVELKFILGSDKNPIKSTYKAAYVSNSEKVMLQYK